MIKIINILLTIGVFVAGYFLVKTLQEPIIFKTESEKRDKLVIEKLTYIKELQLAYKAEHNQFASSFDSLAYFVNADSMTITKIIGDKDELDADGNAVAVTYEIIKIPVKDTLTNPNYGLATLANVPLAEGEKFDLEANKLERGKLTVPVFEVSVGFDRMLKGLKTKYIDASQVRKVGSLTDVNYNGNW